MNKINALVLIAATALLIGCSSNKSSSSSSSSSGHTHTSSGAYEHDETNHYHVCDICSEHYDVSAHAYGLPVIVDPTAETEGSATYTCTVCEYQKVEVLPKVEYEFVIATPTTYDGVPYISLIDELGNAYVTKNGNELSGLSAQNYSLKNWSVSYDSERHLCEEAANVTFIISKAQLGHIVGLHADAEETEKIIASYFPAGKEEISSTQLYSKVEHSGNLKHVISKNPSCIEAGHEEYYECPFCGKIFDDEVATNEKTKEDFTIDSFLFIPTSWQVISGRGTAVTGTVSRSKVSVGDNVVMTYPDTIEDCTVNTVVIGITVNNVSVSSAEDCDAVLLLRGLDATDFITGVIISNVATWHGDLDSVGLCSDCYMFAPICIYDNSIEHITSASYNMPKSTNYVYFYLFGALSTETYEVNFNYTGEATAYVYDQFGDSLDAITVSEGKITVHYDSENTYLYIVLEYSTTTSAALTASVTTL